MSCLSPAQRDLFEEYIREYPRPYRVARKRYPAMAAWAERLFSPDELDQAGYIGAWRAATRYRPGKLPLSQYAHQWVRWEVQRLGAERGHYHEKHMRDRPRCLPLDDPVPVSTLPSPLTVASDNERRALVAEAVAALPPPVGQAVDAVYYKGLDLRAAGALLGVSHEAVRKRVNKGVEMLRSVLREEPATLAW